MQQGAVEALCGETLVAQSLLQRRIDRRLGAVVSTVPEDGVRSAGFNRFRNQARHAAPLQYQLGADRSKFPLQRVQRMMQPPSAGSAKLAHTLAFLVEH